VQIKNGQLNKHHKKFFGVRKSDFLTPKFCNRNGKGRKRVFLPFFLPSSILLGHAHAENHSLRYAPYDSAVPLP
jgi:hypothetical protein